MPSSCCYSCHHTSLSAPTTCTRSRTTWAQWHYFLVLPSSFMAVDCKLWMRALPSRARRMSPPHLTCHRYSYVVFSTKLWKSSVQKRMVSGIFTVTVLCTVCFLTRGLVNFVWVGLPPPSLASAAVSLLTCLCLAAARNGCPVTAVCPGSLLYRLLHLCRGGAQCCCAVGYACHASQEVQVGRGMGERGWHHCTHMTHSLADSPSPASSSNTFLNRLPVHLQIERGSSLNVSGSPLLSHPGYAFEDSFTESP